MERKPQFPPNLEDFYQRIRREQMQRALIGDGQRFRQRILSSFQDIPYGSRSESRLSPEAQLTLNERLESARKLVMQRGNRPDDPVFHPHASIWEGQTDIGDLVAGADPGTTNDERDTEYLSLRLDLDAGQILFSLNFDRMFEFEFNFNDGEFRTLYSAGKQPIEEISDEEANAVFWILDALSEAIAPKAN